MILSFVRNLNHNCKNWVSNLFFHLYGFQCIFQSACHLTTSPESRQNNHEAWWSPFHVDQYAILYSDRLCNNVIHDHLFSRFLWHAIIGYAQLTTLPIIESKAYPPLIFQSNICLEVSNLLHWDCQYYHPFIWSTSKSKSIHTKQTHGMFLTIEIWKSWFYCKHFLHYLSALG